jgi:crotonobetainyl-CoA:carnitine CoA-transferase CaiB-like acyl-CoA transferase
MTGRIPERIGDRSPWFAPQGCYRCAGDDRWVVISCSDDAEFGRMAEVMGHPEWKDDARFRTVLARRDNHDALDDLITQWTSQRDHYYVMHTLQTSEVKSAPVLDGKEALFDPYQGPWSVRHHRPALLGKRPMPRHVAAKFSRSEAKAQHPRLGEHNAEVLKNLATLTPRSEPHEERHRPEPRPGAGTAVSAALKLPYDKYIEHGILQAIEPDYREQPGLVDRTPDRWPVRRRPIGPHARHASTGTTSR